MIDPEELNKEIQKNIEQYKTENSKKKSYENKCSKAESKNSQN